MRSLARRYARALAQILFEADLPAAQQHAELRKSKQQLTHFSALLRQVPELRTVLSSPAVSGQEKLAVLDRLRARLRLSDLIRNFLAVLLDHRRLDLLPQVLSAFDTEVYTRLGIVPVEVTTVLDLDNQQKQLLQARLTALTGSQVETRFRQDPEILAGMVARLGSTIYDGSLRAQLRRLQRHLTAESR